MATDFYMSRQRFQHNANKLCHDITNWVATVNIDNTKKSCHNIITKLQQEVKLSGNKLLSRQTSLHYVETFVSTKMQIIQDNITT